MVIPTSDSRPTAVLDRSLEGVCRHAHQQALQALDAGGCEALDAVGWLSAHLAALDREVHPALAARSVAARAVRRARAADRQLHDALWRLDRRLTGDLRLSGRPVASCIEEVRSALAEHVRAERALLPLISPALAERLGAQVIACMERAPTRPHPHTPHRGPAGRLAFLVEGTVDRWRDTLDTRRTTAPRRIAAPLAAGRWAEYLAGGPGRGGGPPT